MWRYLPSSSTYDIPINPNYQNIFIALVLMFLEECMQDKECWTPMSTHANVPIHTPALAISLTSTKLLLLSTSVSHNAPR